MGVPDDSDSEYDDSGTEAEDSDTDDQVLVDSDDLPVPSHHHSLPSVITTKSPLAHEQYFEEELTPMVAAPAEFPQGLIDPTRARRSLPLPGFLKRSASSKSITSLTITDSSSAGPSAPPSRATSRLNIRRITRKASSASLNDDEVSNRPAGAKPKRRIRKRTKRKDAHGYSFNSANDILGMCFIEIQSATHLPRWRNMTGLSFDMDPFVVIAFGKKVFRTRIVRHSLNPVWEERLWFHVRRHESGFKVLLSIYDWDKVSSNDFVGDTSFDLSELLDRAPKPDETTGLYNSHPGGLVDDHLTEFELPITPAKSGELTTSNQKSRVTVRAKFTPYAALRQQFWRQYMHQYGACASFSPTFPLPS